MNAEDFAIMVSLGMTPIAALKSATLVNAELLGVAKQLGTLEEGKLGTYARTLHTPEPIDVQRNLSAPGTAWPGARGSRRPPGMMSVSSTCRSSIATTSSASFLSSRLR